MFGTDDKTSHTPRNPCDPMEARSRENRARVRADGKVTDLPSCNRPALVWRNVCYPRMLCPEVVYMKKQHKGNASTPKRATPYSGSHRDSRLHWRELKYAGGWRSTNSHWKEPRCGMDDPDAEDSGWQISRSRETISMGEGCCHGYPSLPAQI